MLPFVIAVTIVHILSLIFMGVMIFEYLHIHEKHMILLYSFGDPHILHKRWRKWLLMGAYAFFTLAISATTIAFLLYLFRFIP